MVMELSLTTELALRGGVLTAYTSSKWQLRRKPNTKPFPRYKRNQIISQKWNNEAEDWRTWGRSRAYGSMSSGLISTGSYPSLCLVTAFSPLNMRHRLHSLLCLVAEGNNDSDCRRRRILPASLRKVGVSIHPVECVEMTREPRPILLTWQFLNSYLRLKVQSVLLHSIVNERPVEEITVICNKYERLCLLDMREPCC